MLWFPTERPQAGRIDGIPPVVAEAVRDELDTIISEIEGGKEIVTAPLPALLTCQKGLNEPRLPSLPNIMKAKKKPLDEKTPADYGVDVTPRLEIVKTTEPEARKAGEIVG